MSTALSNKDLLEKCKRFIQADPTEQGLDDIIQDAIITAEREIRDVDIVPLAWLRGSYDELFTHYAADISAVTQADYGVFSADSQDPDVDDDDHGFSNNDIVYLSGLGDMERVNERIFRLMNLDDETFYLNSLLRTSAYGLEELDTTNYEAYDSGGAVYHLGQILPATTIEPTAGLESTASYRWKIGRVFNVTFDLYPTEFISEDQVVNDRRWYSSTGRPRKVRYWKHYYTGMTGTAHEHFLLWYGPPNNKYNICIHFTKDYPNISVWDTATYPPQPPEIHDYIWHRALANLVTVAERQRREYKPEMENTRGFINTRIEVLYAQHWLSKQAQEEDKIINLSRKMLGQDVGSPECSGGMTA